MAGLRHAAALPAPLHAWQLPVGASQYQWRESSPGWLAERYLPQASARVPHDEPQRRPPRRTVVAWWGIGRLASPCSWRVPVLANILCVRGKFFPSLSWQKHTEWTTFAKYRLVNFETCAVRDKIRTTHSACHGEIVTHVRRPRAPVQGAARDAP